jgi:SAM-dependent methyltransferase
MPKQLWAEVANRMNEHGYMHGVERTVDRVRATGEVFTPTELVVEMVAGLPLNRFAPGLTVLDPACGDGQFLVAAKWVKVIAHGMSEPAALADLYGIDIMRDNVDLCRRRLGGGTILMGNALDPFAELDGQTELERDQMIALFGDAPLTKTTKKRSFHVRKAHRRPVMESQTTLGLVTEQEDFGFAAEEQGVRTLQDADPSSRVKASSGSSRG